VGVLTIFGLWHFFVFLSFVVPVHEGEYVTTQLFQLSFVLILINFQRPVPVFDFYSSHSLRALILFIFVVFLIPGLVLFYDFSVGIQVRVVNLKARFCQVIKGVDATQGIADRNLQAVPHAVETDTVLSELIEVHWFLNTSLT
jgi:hypothetical protein